MHEVIPLLISGLATGAIYGLIGIGFVLIHNVTGIINFAQGDFVMLGALAATSMIAAGTPLPLVALAVPLAVATLGAGLERAAIAPARGLPPVKIVVITIGLSIILRGAALLAWGVTPRSYPAFTAGPPLSGFGVSLNRQSLWIIGFTLLAAGLLWLFFTRSLQGKAMQACAMSPLAARLQGISPARLSMAAFAIAGGLAAAAGVVIVPVTTASYDMGLALGLNGFAAAIVGGLVSPIGALAGGFVIGAVEAAATGLISSSLKNAIVFGILLAVLLVRREGLLAVGRERRV